MFLFWRTGMISMDLCRDCGKAIYVENQARCLTRGWWGLIGLWANLVVLVMNRNRLGHHQRGLKRAKRRDPAVVTPMDSPMRARPIGERPFRSWPRSLLSCCTAASWPLPAQTPHSSALGPQAWGGCPTGQGKPPRARTLWLCFASPRPPRRPVHARDRRSRTQPRPPGIAPIQSDDLTDPRVGAQPLSLQSRVKSGKPSLMIELV